MAEVNFPSSCSIHYACVFFFTSFFLSSILLETVIDQTFPFSKTFRTKTMTNAMADPMMRYIVPSLPLTDESLPTVCAQIRNLIASAGSTSPRSPSKRVDQFNVSIKNDHKLTIHSSRTEVLQDPMVQASYLRACGNSKARVNTSGAIEGNHHEGFRAPLDELHPEAGFQSRIEARSQSEKSLGLLEARDSWRKARDLKRKTRELKEKAQNSKKGSRMSIDLVVRLMHDLERVGSDLAQSDFFDSSPMLSNPVADLSCFPGDVIINGNAEMARLSALAGDAASRSDAISVEPELSVRHIAFWTNASCPIQKSDDDDERGCGICAVYRPPKMQSGDDEWITEGYLIPRLVDAAFAETPTVLWALMIAKKRYPKAQGQRSDKLC